jgi:hypothetical protein
VPTSCNFAIGLEDGCDEIELLSVYKNEELGLISLPRLRVLELAVDPIYFDTFNYINFIQSQEMGSKASTSETKNSEGFFVNNFLIPSPNCNHQYQGWPDRKYSSLLKSMLKISHPKENQSDYAILYFHGNAENVCCIEKFLYTISRIFICDVYAYEYPSKSNLIQNMDIESMRNLLFQMF